MSNADNTPPADLKEIPASTGSVVVDDKEEAPANPEAAAPPDSGASPAGEERPKILSWTRAGAAKGPSGVPRAPALPPPSPAEPAREPATPEDVKPKDMTLEDMGAPFVQAIESSFSESRNSSSPAKPEDNASDEKTAEKSASAMDGVRPGGERPALAPSSVIALFRERPFRRELKIAVAVAAIWGAGFLVKHILVDRPSRLGETAPVSTPVNTGERASASINAPAAASPEVKAPEPRIAEVEIAEVKAVEQPAPEPQTPEFKTTLEIESPQPAAVDSVPAGPPPASTPVEDASNSRNAPPAPSPETSRSEGAADGVVEAHAEAPASDAVAVVSAEKSSGAVATIPPPQASQEVAERLARRAKTAGAKEAKELDPAEVGFRAALARGKATGDKQLMATASGELGAIFYKRGELDAAEAAFRRSLVLYEELSPGENAIREGAARTSGALGQVHRDRGQFDKAEKMYNKAADIDKALGRDAELASDYNNLGLVYLARKKLDQAEHVYLEVLRIEKALRSNEGIASSYASLGQVYFTSGDLDRSVEMFKKAIAIEDSGRLKRGIALDYSNLGVVYVKRRDFASACSCWRKARRMLQEAGMKPELGRVQRALRAQSCALISEAAILE